MKPTNSSLYMFDKTVFTVSDSQCKIIYQDDTACYSGVVNEYFSKEVHGVKDAKTLRFVYPNTLMNTERRLKRYSKFFLDFLKDEGLFRKGTVRESKFKYETPYFLERYALRTRDIKDTSHCIVLEYDLTSDVSMQEIFFYGLLIRTMSCFPRVIVAFHRLVKLFPNESRQRLFLLAFKVVIHKNDKIETQGHILLAARSPYLIKNESFIQTVFNHIDNYKYKPVLKLAKEKTFWGNHRFDYSGGLEALICGQQLRSQDNIGRNFLLCRGDRFKVTQKLLDVFKDEEKFKEVFKSQEFKGKSFLGLLLY